VHPCTLPFRPAKAVPYLSRKYGQQQKIEYSEKCRSPDMFFIQLSGKFSRVKRAYLEAQLRPVEQLDKRPPWKVRKVEQCRSTGLALQLSRRRVWVPIIMEV
jgi:hypothetical protein